MDNLEKKIRHLLIDKEKTITELAEKMDLTRAGLYYKMDNNSWNMDDLKALALFFEVSVGTFFE